MRERKRKKEKKKKAKHRTKTKEGLLVINFLAREIAEHANKTDTMVLLKMVKWGNL